MSREQILRGVRSALGLAPGQTPPPPPPVMLSLAEIPPGDREEMFAARLTALGGKFYRADTPSAARETVERLTLGKSAIASNEPWLREIGITRLPHVRSGITDTAALRDACATCDCGITSATYALADTGTLVLLASAAEARMISLLPPIHIAVVPSSRMLSSLDELLTILPCAAEQTSSMVLITGPSRTGDIEQILVRGVHGPGDIHVILV